MNHTNWLRKAVYTDGFKIVEKIYHLLCCEISDTESYLYICTPSGIIQLRASLQNGIHNYEPVDGRDLNSSSNTLGFLHTLCEITSIPYEPVEITCILSPKNGANSRCDLTQVSQSLNLTQIQQSTKHDSKLIQLSCPVLKNSWNSIHLESFAIAGTEKITPCAVIGFDLTGFISKWDLRGNLTDIYNYIPETIGCIKTDNINLYVADSGGLLQVYNVLTGSLVSELLFESEIISIAVVGSFVYLLCIDGLIIKLSRESWKCISNCKRVDYFRCKKMISAGNDLYLIGEFDHVERINFEKMSRCEINFAEFDFAKDEFITLTANKTESFVAAGTKCGYLYIFEVCDLSPSGLSPTNNTKCNNKISPNYIRYYCGTYGSKIANVGFASDHFYVAFCNGFIARYDADLLRLASYDQQSAVVKKYMIFVYALLRRLGLPKDVIGEIMLLL